MIWKTFDWSFWDVTLPKENQGCGWVRVPRYSLARFNPRVPTIVLSRARLCAPPIYDKILTLFPCRHRNIQHVVSQDLTQHDECQRCGEVFNYALTI